jgi:hypothetical protein
MLTRALEYSDEDAFDIMPGQFKSVNNFKEKKQESANFVQTVRLSQGSRRGRRGLAISQRCARVPLPSLRPPLLPFQPIARLANKQLGQSGCLGSHPGLGWLARQGSSPYFWRFFLCNQHDIRGTGSRGLIANFLEHA